ncbi:MAG TPA: phospholipase D family protein [Propionicimonas sp.]|jgi:phosphatidylserine/phosphatidylglycerophosphate/cardiolipin synthase-like enzyme
MTGDGPAKKPPLGARADAAAGRLVESAFRRRHQRRLGRRGWASALEADPGVPSGTEVFPVRAGNSVEILVDGKDAFAAMASAIRGAERSVQIAGWHATPDFLLERSGSPLALGEVLAVAARRADVNVLLWGGAKLPVMHPTRADARAARDAFAAIPGVTVALDTHEYLQHCHHEKLLIVDGEQAFVGGLDLTDLESDRWDTTAHHPRPSSGWHDAATRLRGPVVGDVAAHFGARWAEVTGETLPTPAAPERCGPYAVQCIRTIPEKVYRFARNGDFTILAAYRRALSSAQRLIYLENQFLWAPEIVDILEAKLRHPPSPEFRLLLVLPRRPATGRDTTLGQLSRLVGADVDHRLLAATLQPTAAGSPGTYVHAKVGIVDDEWLTLGSANLNAHSLFNDTEMNVVITDPELVTSTRLRLWGEHLGTEDPGGSPDRVFDERWVPIAREQLDRHRSGLPPTHRLCELEGVSARRDLVLGGLVGIVVDG